MVDVARYFMEFCVQESCGKCIPCRAGTVQLVAVVNQVCESTSNDRRSRALESLCGWSNQPALCGLGQAAPNPVFSTLRHFRDEYLAAIPEVSDRPVSATSSEANTNV
jgi:bidirectional [NiFe] hydrogenase diaphorase subunit